jgi:hypothetical protein
VKENPARWRGNPQALREGCIIKTAELGLIFVQIEENLIESDELDRLAAEWERQEEA